MFSRSVYLDPSVTIKKAASRARGDRYAKLLAICEGQRSITTLRLGRIIAELMASDRQDALHFQALAEFVRKHQ